MMKVILHTSLQYFLANVNPLNMIMTAPMTNVMKCAESKSRIDGLVQVVWPALIRWKNARIRGGILAAVARTRGLEGLLATPRTVASVDVSSHRRGAPVAGKVSSSKSQADCSGVPASSGVASSPHSWFGDRACKTVRDRWNMPPRR